MLPYFTLLHRFSDGFGPPLSSKIGRNDAMTVLDLSLRKVWSHHVGILALLLRGYTGKLHEDKEYLSLHSEFEGTSYPSYLLSPAYQLSHCGSREASVTSWA